LCVNIPAEHKAHWLQPGVGHYGVFNGSRFRSEIAPRIADFVLTMDHGARPRRGNGFAAHKGRNGAKPPGSDRTAATAGLVPARVDH
jgi:hypothetical protein